MNPVSEWPSWLSSSSTSGFLKGKPASRGQAISNGGEIMLRLWTIVLATIAAVFLAGVTVVNIAEAQGGKSTVVTPTPTAEETEKERKLAAATDAAKQLLLVMDTNKSGKVSKEEWMKFMEAEFDRLDTDHKGQLDVKELTQSRVRVRPSVGK
jgi:uncharacterized membrane protein YdfJ with MMPL/SSD domain